MPEGRLNVGVDELKDLIATAIAEAKRPTNEDAAAQAKAEYYKTRARDGQAAAALTEHIGKEKMQRGCRHQKDDGRYSISGQITNDGLLTQICSRCSGMWTSKPSPEMMSGDLNINGLQPLGKRVTNGFNLEAAEAELKRLTEKYATERNG